MVSDICRTPQLTPGVIDIALLQSGLTVSRAAGVGGTPPKLAGGTHVRCAPASSATLHLRLLFYSLLQTGEVVDNCLITIPYFLTGTHCI